MEYNGSMCWYKAVANERTVIMKEYMNAANTLICTPCPTKVPSDDGRCVASKCELLMCVCACACARVRVRVCVC